ncbi:26S proteasome non-ATPase regulatory subunit 7 B [Prototheca wickerhamii]|uniref:26S proteasome non-ATPase regulatory subunit 7 B n=1 Tax=Prototheca wickerhamii TaxID=3111 RepID=A0AAD9ID55_PROWI|nr:26S proteasome non-ATPase regulatory subunit 7 B [Prototheca wickerhamii]
MVSESIDKVVVHPLVLLSVVDHYNRVAKDTRKRVVGVLLGESYKGRIDATNSFAVPFEEDEKDPSIWFLDHNYLENMFRMFKKVNARERIIGWYHTGPRLRESDLDIQALFSTYCHDPVLVITEVQPREMGLPVHAYTAIDEIKEDATQKAQRVFANLPTEVGATEAEEIGVEHLLRDVRDATVSSLSSRIGDVVTGLRTLAARLSEIQEYLRAVVAGKLPLNHEILAGLQDILTLLPNLEAGGLAKGLSVQLNDSLLVVYVASLIRSIVALHSLIENKEERLAATTKGQETKEEEEKKPDAKEAAKQ